MRRNETGRSGNGASALMGSAAAGLARSEVRRGGRSEESGGLRRLAGVLALVVLLTAIVAAVETDRASAKTSSVCPSIHWVFAPANAPAAALGDVSQAFAQLSRATELNFVFDGTTGVVPSDSWAGGTRRPILVAWSAPSDRAVAWTSGQVGKGYGNWESLGAKRTFIAGFVYLNAAAALRPGFSAGATVGGALLHELGHVMGLGHSTFDSDVMYPTIVPRRNASYSDSDKERLATIGAPCRR